MGPFSILFLLSATARDVTGRPQRPEFLAAPLWMKRAYRHPASTK